MVDLSSFRGLSLLCISLLCLADLVWLLVNGSWSRIYCQVSVWMGCGTMVRHAGLNLLVFNLTCGRSIDPKQKDQTRQELRIT